MKWEAGWASFGMEDKPQIPPFIAHIRRHYIDDLKRKFSRGEIDKGTMKRRIALIKTCTIHKGPEMLPIFAKHLEITREIYNSAPYLKARPRIKEHVSHLLVAKEKKETYFVHWLDFWEVAGVVNLPVKIHPLQKEARLKLVPHNKPRRRNRRRKAKKSGNVESPLQLLPDGLNPAESVRPDQPPPKPQFEPVSE